MKKEILEKLYKTNKNLIIEGEVASGKTANVLFPIVDKIIENKESLFIVDSREEYINKYYNILKENNYNTIIINLRDMDKSDGWNPLDYPYKLYKNGNADKAQEYLEKIGTTIFYENEVLDPFWSNTASDFFTGVTLALFEDGASEEINFLSISNMFNGVNKKYGTSDYLTEYFKTKSTTSMPYIFASTTLLAPRETKGSILSIAKQKIRLLVSRDKLTNLMNNTTFNIEDIINKPTAIIVIDRDDSKSLNKLTTMFIEQLYAILLENNCKSKYNFILDNFDTIEHSSDLINILGSCISRSIKFYIATRSLDKLSHNYDNYITKLCDLVLIRNKDIKLVISNEEEIILKNFETAVLENEIIEYPNLNTKNIKIFDFEKKVQKLSIKEFDDSYSNELENTIKFEDFSKIINDNLELIRLAEKHALEKNKDNERKN